MWIIPILIAAGFAAGYWLDVPFGRVPSMFLALIFLGLLDSMTYGIARDVAGQKANNGPILIRLFFGLAIGGFIIYFGLKSGIDLYYIALLPLALGFALNLYKFLPK
jgi:small basic protein